METERAGIALPQQFNDRFIRGQYNDPVSSTQHSTYGKFIPLHLRRKVFISHSGCDKDFVRWLYRDLCSGYHGIEGVAFFDEKTLPKGEFVSMVNILEEAKSSKLGVLVLTDAFFMSTPNPMLELEAFVDGEVKLLPLFFSMSVNEFKEKQRRDRWEEKWKEWAAKDKSLVIDRWRSHLDVVSRVCGLEYCKTATNWNDFIHIVVKEVIRIVGPFTPFCSNIEVHGMARMCKEVNDLYGGCASKCSPAVGCTYTQVASTSANSGNGEDVAGYKIDVVAIYGFPGLGKTTLSQCLCDFYFGDFHGNVFYIELGLACTRRVRMEHVLSGLSKSPNNDSSLFSQLSDKQVENMLKTQFCSMKDPVFLAIDNISPDLESQEEAGFYMSCEYKKGSKVLITSRSKGILENLTELYSHRFSVKSRYMFKLKSDEARDIFEQEFPNLREARLSNLPREPKLESDVDAVLKMGTINSDQFHPLLLKSLATFVKWDAASPPHLHWKGRLAKLAEEGMVYKNDELKMVFQVFKKTYAILSPEEKKVFLDLVLFNRVLKASKDLFQSYRYTGESSLLSYKWIQMLHSKSGKKREERHRHMYMERILSKLQNLGFIERQWNIGIRIQDLLLDYGKHEADANSDQYVVVDDGDAWPDMRDICASARHVSISRCQEASGMVLDLRKMERMQVLHLLGNEGRPEVILTHSACAHLRSLIVSVPAGAELCCRLDTENLISPCFNLECLKLHGNINVASLQDRPLMAPQMDPGSMFMGSLRNLEILHLVAVPTTVQLLDATFCAKLKELAVQNIPGLKFIQGPKNQSQLSSVKIRSLPHLQELALTSIHDAVLAATVHRCVSLKKFAIECGERSPSWRAGLAAGAFLTGFPCFDVNVKHCPRLTNVDGLLQYVTGPAIFKIDGASVLGDTPHKFKTDHVSGESIGKAGIFLASFCRKYMKGVFGDSSLICIKAVALITFRRPSSKIQPTNLLHLQRLEMTCRQGGYCVCDQYAPRFGPLKALWLRRLKYSCSKVRDLASLSNCSRLRELDLYRCTALEIWPDFSGMTSLDRLFLYNTSLKEVPSSLLHLLGLQNLCVNAANNYPPRRLYSMRLHFRISSL